MKPVMLPPGRERLSTKPWPTGSVTSVKTIGTVRVVAVGRDRSRIGDRKQASAPSATSSSAITREQAPIAAGERHSSRDRRRLSSRAPQGPLARPRRGTCRRDHFRQSCQNPEPPDARDGSFPAPAPATEIAAAPPRSLRNSRRLIRSPLRRPQARSAGISSPSAAAALQIDCEHELLGLYDRQVSGLFALENSADIAARHAAWRP